MSKVLHWLQLFRRRSTATLAAAAILVLTAHPVSAESWVIRPTARIQQAVDDNYRLSIDDQDRVSTTRAQLSALLSRLTERFELDGLIRADTVNYAGDDEDLNNENNQLARVSSLYRPDELNSIDIEATFKRDTLLRTVEVNDEPDDVTIDPDDDIDDGIVRRNVRRDRLVVKPSWSRRLDEISSMRLNYVLNDVNFSNVGGTNLADFSENRLGGEYQVRFTEKNRFTTSLAVQQFRVPDNDREDISYALLGGLIHEFSETETGSVRVGLRRTEFKAGSERSDDSGYVLRINGSKRTGLTTFSAKVERSLAPSGSGEQVERMEVTFNVSRKFSETMQGTLRTRVYETETLRVNDLNVTRRYFQVEPRVRWRLSRQMAFDAIYRFRTRKIDGDPDSADSNSILLSLNYTQPTALE